jgi:8-hydroxy-5-deazaflavin:NADPH oxidoreductase
VEGKIMKVEIFGSGMVGQALGGKLADVGQEVVMGTRDPAKLQDWLIKIGGTIRAASLADAAAHGEILVNATNGRGSLEALAMAGKANLSGKILIDISNPLEFSQGMPPFWKERRGNSSR